jgi:hypothetical protein
MHIEDWFSRVDQHGSDAITFLASNIGLTALGLHASVDCLCVSDKVLVLWLSSLVYR